MKPKEAVWLRILSLCEERNMTPQDLAVLCGITITERDTIEKRKDISISTIQKICDGLEIDFPEFFDSEEFANGEMENS